MRAGDGERSRSRGLGLMEVLIGGSLGAAALFFAVQTFVGASRSLQTNDLGSAREKILLGYRKLAADRRIRARLIAANPELSTYLTGSPPAVVPPTQGSLELVDMSGTVRIPRTGLFVGKHGEPAAPPNDFWVVRADWRGTGPGDFKVEISARPNNAPQGGSPEARTTEVYEKSEINCVTVKAGPVLGPRVGPHAFDETIGLQTWSAGMAGTASRPPDSQFTRLDVTCPPGTVLASVRTVGACGAGATHSYPRADDLTLPAGLRSRTGTCAQFTGVPTNPNCTVWIGVGGQTETDVFGLECEARCCAFPF